MAENEMTTVEKKPDVSGSFEDLMIALGIFIGNVALAMKAKKEG